MRNNKYRLNIRKIQNENLYWNWKLIHAARHSTKFLTESTKKKTKFEWRKRGIYISKWPHKIAVSRYVYKYRVHCYPTPKFLQFKGKFKGVGKIRPRLFILSNAGRSIEKRLLKKLVILASKYAPLLKRLKQTRGKINKRFVKLVKAIRLSKKLKILPIDWSGDLIEPIRFVLRHKSFKTLWGLYKWSFFFKKMRKTYFTLDKKFKAKTKMALIERVVSPTLKKAWIRKYSTWGPKERKRWKAHRFLGKFFQKAKDSKLWLRKSYLYKLIFKKFLKQDFSFIPETGCTYARFLKAYQRLLIKYLTNLPFVKNIFKSRFLIRTRMIKVNYFGQKKILEDFDIVSFSRTEPIRKWLHWDRIMAFSDVNHEKLWFKLNQSYLLSPDLIYNKKKFFFVVLPQFEPTRSNYQVRTEKKFFSHFAYRLLTINRY